MDERLKPSEIDEHLSKIKPHPVVALVDDDTATLDLLERALHDEGFETRRFERAEDLLSRLSEIHPDAVVMEAVLPGLSGLSALEELSPRSPEEMIPVLILSKKDDLGTKILAFRRGAFDYVAKPFQAEEVAARVRALVRSKALQEMLRASSISDPLTSLYNRRFLLAWLEREMARVKRYGLELACLLVDLDQFHEINKEQGERFGDFLLREFAELIRQNTRASDIAGRVKNDAFLILLPGTSKENARLVARRLRDLARGKRFEKGRRKVEPSFCIGITGCHAKEAPEAAVFLKQTEEALERAKAVGKGETVVA